METSTLIKFILIPAFAYLLGSIPSGLLLTRLFASKDIRKHGSGNIGATNVRRIAGLKLGLATLLADLAKGALPVALVKFCFAPNGLGYQELLIAVAAISAFLGHLYPCFLKFSGGKGVATAAGCFFVMSPMGCLTSLVIFFVAVVVSNRVSVGSLLAASALPIAVWYMTHNPIYGLCAVIMTVFIFLKHSDNIKRLMNGTEPKFR